MGKFAIFLFVFGFISVIKVHNYDRTPGANHAEELLYSWSGIHLIETGVPVSWSTLNYPDSNLIYDGIVGDTSNLFLPAKLYKPWLDEPPLYSLMSGGVAHLYGDDRREVIPTSRSRVPSVIASIITSVLVFWVGYKFFSFKMGILSMLVYGLTPIFVLGSRLSVPENVIAMAVTGCLLLGQSYLKKPKFSIAVIFGVLSFILGLMKPTGFFLAPLTMFLAARKGKWNHAGIIFGLTLLGVAAFAAYGYYYDWELFKEIVSIQGQRFAGWSGLGHVFTSPSYDIFQMYDGWYIFALLFSIYFGLKKRKSDEVGLLVLFFFYWLMIAVFSGTEQDLLPWYRYMMFPIMAIFGALGIREVIKNPSFFNVAFTLGLLLSSRYYLSNAHRPTTPTNVFRFTYLLAIVPSLVYMVWHKKWAKKLSAGILVVFIGLGLWLNSKYLYNVFEISCESISCPFGPSTKLSETKMPLLWRFLILKPSDGMLTEKRPWF
jgi:4-amino-4-deoxy-L-arabinose transferase-like glycosyltransferase